MKVLSVPAEKKAGKVACVGAGPASLAVASELAKEGYDVTIFEREAKAGGVLTYGIVPSRLPQSVVDYDISKVEELGVKFVFNTEVKAADLEGFDAAFIGVGLWGPNLPGIEGIDLPGVYAAVDYLKAARSGAEGFNAGKRVLVVGGGDVAVDCAVTAKLQGAEDVKIVYRRTIEEAPGNLNEFQYALSLGIGMTTGMAPDSIVGDGKVEAVNFKGFRDEAAKLTLSADTIVFATGQKAEDVSAIAGVDVTDKKTIAADANGITNVDGIFSAGDIVNGGKTVVEAVAAGKVAAFSIMQYLEKKGVK